jgi:uncharacterized membrane protein HdeD (DUF308 family)
MITNETVFKKIAYPIRHWWVSLLLGVLFIITGIWVLRTPVAGYLALATLFSIVLIINGVAEVLSALAMTTQTESAGWGWILAGGIIDILIGIVLVSNPGITVIILAFFIAFGLLFRGMMAIGTAIDLRKSKDSYWGLLLLIGILGLIFPFIILENPAIVGFTVVFWTGLAFLIIGIFRVILAFRLRRLNKSLPDV